MMSTRPHEPVQVASAPRSSAGAIALATLKPSLRTTFSLGAKCSTTAAARLDASVTSSFSLPLALTGLTTLALCVHSSRPTPEPIGTVFPKPSSAESDFPSLGNGAGLHMGTTATTFLANALSDSAVGESSVAAEVDKSRPRRSATKKAQLHRPDRPA